MADPKVKACLTFAGANNATSFSDVQGNAWTGVLGARLSTASPLFAPASGLCALPGDYFTSAGGAAYRLGSGDFAIEVWFETSQDSVCLLDASDGDAAGGYRIAMNGGGSNPSLFIYSNGGLYLETFLSPLGYDFKNTGLCYVCFQRIGTRVGVFFGNNGNAPRYLTYGDISDATNLNLTPGAVLLGRQGFDPTNRQFAGKFGGVRVTVGGSRWAWDDHEVMPSPYDSLGSGSTIVEASAVITAQVDAAGLSATLLGAAGALDGSVAAAGAGQKLLGADAIIKDATAANEPFTPGYGYEGGHFPPAAYRVPVSQKLNLQTLLDAHNVIRVDKGDYKTGGISKLVVKTGQQVLGIPGIFGSFLPTIETQPGATGVVVKGVNATLSYPASASVTKGNTYGMLNGDIVALDATLEGNLWASLGASVRIDNTSGGTARNNRWIRIRSQGAGLDGRPAFLLKGGAGRTSYGNGVVAYNALGPFYSSMEVSGQGYFAVVGYDEESYDIGGGVSHQDGKASVVVRDTGEFNIIGAAGAIVGNDAIDTGADKTNIVYSDLKTTGPGKRLKLQSSATDVSWWKNNLATSLTDLATGGARTWEDGSYLLHFNNTTAPSAVLGADLLRLVGLLATPLPGTMPWGRIVWREIPDPTGPNWAVGLTDRPDDAPALQALLDANLYVELEARTYYIHSSLKLNPGQQIVGVAGVTAIVAVSNTFPIFETGFGTPAEGLATTAGLTMLDFVVQGGRCWLLQGEAGIQLTGFDFSHIVVRDMAEAGSFIQNSYAMDNGWFEYVDFVNVPGAVKQRGTDPDGTSTGPTISYIDKVNFFRCQFDNCGLGIDLFATRANNLNTWTECYFRNCTDGAVSLRGGNNTPMFTNCVIDNCGGNAAVQAFVGQVFFTGCYFKAHNSNLGLVSQCAVCEGCTFERGSSTITRIFDWTPVALTEGFGLNAGLFNCVSVDVPLGPIDAQPGVGNSRINFVSVNTAYPQSESRWQKTVTATRYITQGTPYIPDDTRVAQVVFADGAIAPGSRFLRDAGALPGAAAANILFVASAIAGAVGALVGDPPLAGVGGSIRAAAWAAPAQLDASFASNAIAGAEGEIDADLVVDTLFLGGATAAGIADVNALGDFSGVGGAFASAELADEAGASLDGLGSAIRSGVAEAVLEMIFNAQGGTAAGSGGPFQPAPALRTMQRPQQLRLMTRPEQPRVMVSN